MITEKGEITTSYLLVQRAQPADSGSYTCHPSNANEKSINVHVLNGELWFLCSDFVELCGGFFFCPLFFLERS